MPTGERECLDPSNRNGQCRPPFTSHTTGKGGYRNHFPWGNDPGDGTRPPTGELVPAAVKEACDVGVALRLKLTVDIITDVLAAAEATGSDRPSLG